MYISWELSKVEMHPEFILLLVHKVLDLLIWISSSRNAVFVLELLLYSNVVLPPSFIKNHLISTTSHFEDKDEYCLIMICNEVFPICISTGGEVLSKYT